MRSKREKTNLFDAVSNSLRFLYLRERVTYFLLIVAKCSSSILDLVGVVLVGYLASYVTQFSSGGNSPIKSFSILGVTLTPLSGQNLLFVCLAIVSSFLLKGLISAMTAKALTNHLADIEARASRKIADSALGQSLHESKTGSQEKLIVDVQIGSGAAFGGLLYDFSVLVSEASLFLALITLFLLLDPVSTLGLILFLLLVAGGIQQVVGNRISKAAAFLTPASVEANQIIIDLYSSYREVTVLGRRDNLLDKLFEARTLISKSVAEQIYLTGLPRHIMESSLILGVFGFSLLQMSFGDVAGAATLIGMFLIGGLKIMSALLPWQQAIISIRKNIPLSASVHELLLGNDAENISDNKNPETKTDFTGVSISFQDVWFKYADSQNQTIQRLSFHLEAGKQMAIIGDSGAGKSTIADLALGLLGPDSGKILLGDKAPADFIREYPGKVAYVPQKPGIISGNILENIAIGIPTNEVNIDAVNRAIKVANLEEVISNLPSGIFTELGKHKDELSGGQLQRIGLARALYSDPKLLVLDEATSALDSDSESAIIDSLSKLKGEISVLMIAHRMSSIRTADSVIVIDKGRVREIHTSKSFLSRNQTGHRKNF